MDGYQRSGKECILSGVKGVSLVVDLAFEDASVEGHLRIFFGGLSSLLLVLTSACTQEFCDTTKWVDVLRFQPVHRCGIEGHD